MIIGDYIPQKGGNMDFLDAEIVLLSVIVILSYFLPAMLWLFHLHDRAKLSKIGNEQEYKKIVWFSKHKESLTLSQIRFELISKEQKAKIQKILFIIMMLYIHKGILKIKVK